MSITVLDCATTIRLTLGADAPAELPTLQIVNDAGKHLCSMTAWRWLEGRSTTIDSVASQNYVELPDDFAAVIAVDVAARPACMIPCTRERMDLLRANQNTAVDAGYISWCISYIAAGADNPEDPPRPIMEIDPPQATATSDFFSLTYRAAWPDLTIDTQYIPIPPWLETLYRLTLQAFARGYLREEHGSVTDRLAALASTQRGTPFSNALRDDRSKQTTWGQIRGSMPDEREPFVIRTITSGP